MFFTKEGFILVDECQIEEKEKGFFEKKKFQMMQNVHITLKNVHICYETNSTTKLGHPFSFGLTIHSLQLTVRRLFSIVLKQKKSILQTSTNVRRMGRHKANSLLIMEVHSL